MMACARKTLPALMVITISVLWACAPAAEESARADKFVSIRVSWPDGAGPAKLASSSRERAMGYRHLGADEAPPAIYFDYPSPRSVSFHMRDVSFPVRAWWLDERGCVQGFTDMKPGSEGHGSPERVTGVLEVPLSRLDAYPLERGDCISWSRTP